MISVCIHKLFFQFGMSNHPDPAYNRFPQIRNHSFGYSLLFSNNSLLFYPFFYMKMEICFLYKGLSYFFQNHLNVIALERGDFKLSIGSLNNKFPGMIQELLNILQFVLCLQSRDFNIPPRTAPTREF